MILACNHISKSFGTDVIIKDATFHIEERQKAAIIGINGAGKSTLLKIIIGELSADSGNVTLSKDATIGYLAQHQNLSTDNTIYDEVLSVKKNILDMESGLRNIEQMMKEAEGDELQSLMNQYSRLNHEFELKNGYAYKSEVTGVLKGLGFGEADFNLKVNTLSGGQKTRIALSKLLISKPDIIMLDEPTNHLDMESIAWLENYLIGYSGSVIIVAHDRYFLDRIVTKIIEIDNSNVTEFKGNYTDYAAKKEILRNMQLKEYLNQQRDIKHQEEVIARLKQFNREKSIKRAESREKMLDRIERIDKPVELNTAMNITLEPRITSGNDVLSISGLSKSFDGNTLFSDISLDIRRGERVALIGNNGTGKTTILKIINGIIAPDKGNVTLGTNVSIGYYDQEHNILNPDKTLFDELSDAYPDLNNTKIRNTLAAFLFTGDDVFKYIRELSGGERGRVSLAKLMLSNANCLILDEPTNHLDITSKEILENALSSYTGTVLYVSHDRYFINSTATRIIELTGKTIVNYIGNYDYYIQKRDILSASANATAVSETSGASAKNSLTAAKADWQQSKEEQARIRKLNNDLKKTEDKIEQLETRIAELDEELLNLDICTDTGRLMDIHTKREALSKDLELLYEKWENLSESVS